MAAGRARPLGVGGVHHLALGVADESGLLRWKRRLTDRGVPVSGPFDRSYFRSIYFRAPDGMLLEIATDGPGFAVDEDPAELGTSLQLPAWLEIRREEIDGVLIPIG